MVSAFTPLVVLILLTPFAGRSVWRGLGAQPGRVAVAVPVAVAATSYVGARGVAALADAVGNTALTVVLAAALPAAATPMAYLAGEGGVVTAIAMTAVAVVTLVYARRQVWRTAAPIPLNRTRQ